MEQATTIGLDIAKHVFHVHGADAAGHVLFRKRITRAKLLGFLAAQARCVTACRLMTIPGVGPIASTAITALVPAAEAPQFCGRPLPTNTRSCALTASATRPTAIKSP
jgi:transposase